MIVGFRVVEELTCPDESILFCEDAAVVVPF